MDTPNVAEPPDVLSLCQGGADWFAEQWQESGYEPYIRGHMEKIDRAAHGAMILAELLATDRRYSDRAADSGEQYTPLGPRYIEGLHETLGFLLDAAVEALEQMRERNLTPEQA